MKQSAVVTPGLDPLQASPSNTPGDVDKVVEVKILKPILSHDHSDEVWADLKRLSRTSRIRTDEDVHRLRIRSGTTTPTSPLMPTKVEGLDTLSRHDRNVVEDESDVS